MFLYMLDRFSPRGDFCDTDPGEDYCQSGNLHYRYRFTSQKICNKQNKYRFEVTVKTDPYGTDFMYRIKIQCISHEI